MAEFNPFGQLAEVERYKTNLALKVQSIAEQSRRNALSDYITGETFKAQQGALAKAIEREKAVKGILSSTPKGGRRDALIGEGYLKEAKMLQPPTSQWSPVFEAQDKEGNQIKKQVDQFGTERQVGSVRQRKLTPNQANLISEGRQLNIYIDPIKQLLDTKPELFSPLLGRISEENPYAVEAQKAQATLKLAAQNIGKYMEGGVLRREDEIKYRKMLPNLGEKEEVSRHKMEIVDNMLAKKEQQLLSDYGRAGFDVSEFMKPAKPKLPTEMSVVGTRGKAKQPPKGSLNIGRFTVEVVE